jgi:WD40 repeat protein
VLSPSGNYAAAGANNGFIYCWSTETASFEMELGNPKAARRGHRASSAYSQESSSGAGTDDGASLGIGSLDLQKIPHEGVPVYGLDWSPDGRYIASADEKGKVVIWSSE